jgi:hypothetical protein
MMVFHHHPVMHPRQVATMDGSSLSVTRITGIGRMAVVAALALLTSGNQTVRVAETASVLNLARALALP